MNEREKKRQRIYDLLNAETKPEFLCLSYTKHRKFFTETELFKETANGRLNQKRKECLLIFLAMVIKKDLTTSLRKLVNELKVLEKTVKAIKLVFTPDLNPLDYAIVLESKTNATSNPNISSLKTAIKEEWNKMSEKFILKACKSFRRRVETIIEKKMVAILSKFIVSCLTSYFVVYFLKLELILFYYRMVYYYTRIFLILLPYPVYLSIYRYIYTSVTL